VQKAIDCERSNLKLSAMIEKSTYASSLW